MECERKMVYKFWYPKIIINELLNLILYNISFKELQTLGIGYDWKIRSEGWVIDVFLCLT